MVGVQAVELDLELLALSRVVEVGDWIGGGGGQAGAVLGLVVLLHLPLEVLVDHSEALPCSQSLFLFLVLELFELFL